MTKQIEFISMRERLPEGSGFYEVRFEDCEDWVVFLHDLRQDESCEYSPDFPKDNDNPPPFNWGWDENDDPEQLGLDVRDVWGIMWKDALANQPKRASYRTLLPMYLGGQIANGHSRSKGKIVHWCDGGAEALCGKGYDRRSAGWFEAKEPVNCEKCLRLVQK